MAAHDSTRRPPYFSRLRQVGIRFGHCIPDAEDFAQDAYLRMLEYRRTNIIRDEAALLMRITANLAINHYRRRRVVTVAPDELVRRYIDPAVSAGAQDATAQIIDMERLENVARALSRVSPRTCQIFLAHRAGYCYAELCAEFHICARTVQKHITRATIILDLREAPKSRI